MLHINLTDDHSRGSGTHFRHSALHMHVSTTLNESRTVSWVPNLASGRTARPDVVIDAVNKQSPVKHPHLIDSATWKLLALYTAFPEKSFTQSLDSNNCQHHPLAKNLYSVKTSDCLGVFTSSRLGKYRTNIPRIAPAAMPTATSSTPRSTLYRVEPI